MNQTSAAAKKLIDVLIEARRLLSLPGNDYSWSSREDADAALAELDGLIAEARANRVNNLDVSVLFAPTGPIQEVSLSSGWADEFLALAERADEALKPFPRKS